jgi:hypothetical protein
MSAKGHLALARAIASALQARPSTLAPLPQGRSLLPETDEFARAEGSPLPEPLSHDCRVRSVREWVEVSCHHGNLFHFDSAEITLVAGGHGDAIQTYRGNTEVNDILPVLAGDNARIRMDWNDGVYELRLMRKDDGALDVGLRQQPKNWALPGVALANLDAGLNGAYDVACVRRLAGGQYKDCELGTGAMKCREDQMQFGVLRRCVPRCSPTQPCKQGRCTLFQGERGCIEP